jgi:membrane protein
VGTERDDGRSRWNEPGDGPDADLERGRQAETPRGLRSRGWKDVLVRTLQEVKSDDLPMAAAAAAFYAWLALIPAGIAVITLYGLVASPAQVRTHINELTASLSPDVAKVISQPLAAAATSGQSALSVGLVVSLAAVLWTASGGMNGLIQGVNLAYDESDDRSFIRKRGLALLLTFAAIVAFVVAFGLVAVLPGVLELVGLGPVITVVVQVLRWVVLAVLMGVGLAVLYRFAPDRENPRMRWVSRPPTGPARSRWRSRSRRRRRRRRGSSAGRRRPCR